MSEPFVYIAGAGPGKPEYMTLRTSELIKSVDVIIYDQLVDKSVLSASKDACEKIYAGKRAGHHSMKQEEINDLIVAKALEGNKVLRLKGGDPFVFGRGPEECQALMDAGIAYELVPGVTSAISVPMSAGIPVTNREMARSFTVVTGHTAKGEISDEINFEALSKVGGSLIFLMGLGALGTIADELMKYGLDKDTPAAVISNGTRVDQYVLRGSLSTIAEAAESDPRVVTPAIIIVGDDAALDYRSHSDRELSNALIYSCGTNEICHKIKTKASEKGAEVVEIPLLKVVELQSRELADAIEHIEEYGIIAFTGRNAIEAFFQGYRAARADIRKLSGIRIASIGKSTADYLYEEYGLISDLIPEKYNSDSLGDLLVQESHGSRILIPRAVKGSNVIADKLTRAGAEFTEISVYDTISAEDIDTTIRKAPDRNTYITFASAQGVENFFKTGAVIDGDIEVVCIGEYTARALEENGVQDYHTAGVATADGLIEEIIRIEKEKK